MTKVVGLTNAALGTTRRCRHLLLGGLVWLVASGCQLPATAPPTVKVDSREKLQLETRSVDLLLRAAEDGDSVVACNAIEALTRVVPRESRLVFRQALRSPSPMVRYAGYVALGELCDPDVLAHVATGTRDTNAHVRLGAAFAACRCGRDGYARVLMWALTDSPDEGVRADAATLVGRLHDPRASKWLKAGLRHPANEKSGRMRLALFGALARLGDEEAVRELIGYSQGDVASQADALLLLAELGRTEAREALLYCLQHEEYTEPRLLAARGLGQLGVRDGFGLAIEMLSYENPHPVEDDPAPNFRVRSMAIHALAEIGDERALGPLRDIAADQSDLRLQVAACYAICRIAR